MHVEHPNQHICDVCRALVVSCWYCEVCDYDMCQDCAAKDGTFDGICLAIIGRSGTGKTALMAKLASEVRAKDPRRPVIVRFCGTSKGSADGLSMVQSLCHQIQLAVEPRIEAPKTVPENYEAAVQLLHALLKEYAVVLFIDSLDQLSDRDLARSKISFLKGVQPHKDTRIVVSALPDDKEALVCGRKQDNATAQTYYYYGCDTCLATHHVPRVVVSDFSDASAVVEARAILHALFARQQRALTTEQWGAVMAAVAMEPTALYLNLATYMSRQWCSYDGLGKELRGRVTAVSEHIFEALERDYGALLTRAALGFITWSVKGVSDTEIEDLLSLHKEVLDKVLHYCPGVKRLPSHVCLRLRGALKGLVVEHSGGCLQWYHRQLWEAARQRYGRNPEEKRLLHMLMGVYFSDLVDATVVAEKQIHRQPLTLSGAEKRNAVLPGGRAVVVGGAVWTAPLSQINERRAVEASAHLLAAGLVRKAVDELCDLETVCARFKVGVGMDIVPCLTQLQQAMHVLSSVTADERRRAEHYRRWLLRDASSIQNNPQMLLITGAVQPMSSVVRRAAEAILIDTPVPGHHGDHAHYHIGKKVLGGLQDFDALLSLLTGHTDSVTSVSWSSDGTRLASGSWDKTVRVWDVATDGKGAMVATLKGHTDRVWSVSLSSDGTRLASGSEDNTVLVWDVTTGAVVATLQGHTYGKTSVSLSSDGTRLASGSRDKTVRVWDVATGAVVATLKGHTGGVYSVSWSLDGTSLASGSWDKTVRVWDVVVVSPSV